MPSCSLYLLLFKAIVFKLYWSLIDKYGCEISHVMICDTHTLWKNSPHWGNEHIRPSYTHLLFYGEICKFYSLSKFHVYMIALPTAVTRSYVRSPDRVDLTTESLCPFTNQYFPHPLPFHTHTNSLQPPFSSLFLWVQFFFLKIIRISDTIQYLSLSGFNGSRFIPVVQNDRISFFF